MWQREIVNEAAFAADQPGVFPTVNLGSDHRRDRHG
jgi:hypothetical protein